MYVRGMGMGMRMRGMCTRPWHVCFQENHTGLIHQRPRCITQFLAFVHGTSSYGVSRLCCRVNAHKGLLRMLQKLATRCMQGHVLMNKREVLCRTKSQLLCEVCAVRFKLSNHGVGQGHMHTSHIIGLVAEATHDASTERAFKQYMIHSFIGTIMTPRCSAVPHLPQNIIQCLAHPVAQRYAC